MANLSTYHPIVAIEQSNMPAEHKKTAIRAFHERVMAKPAVQAITEVGAVAEDVALADLTGAIVGMAVGYVEHKLGSLDAAGVPLDGIGALLSAGAALPLSRYAPQFVPVARHTSVALTAITFARKTKAHLDEEAGAKPPSGVHGETDPLIAWADRL
jgi:hypothetical protein